MRYAGKRNVDAHDRGVLLQLVLLRGRFSTDYDMAPPGVDGSRSRLHKLTLGLSVCAMF